LRGWSKNVTCRSIFPTFDEQSRYLEFYEHSMVARADPNRPGAFLYGTSKQDWGKEGAPLMTLADVLIEYLHTPGAKPEDLRILLCVHDWVQDEGTASV
jgi:hypothetical protein